jgi:aminopeptidase N
MKKISFLFITFLTTAISVKAQTDFTHADTLRGTLNKNRDWFDIKHYTLVINPNIEQHTLETSRVNWSAKVVKASANIQIDLQQPLEIDKIEFAGLIPTGKGNELEWVGHKTLQFTREGNVAIAILDTSIAIGTEFQLDITYHGKPREAVRPPWDGGWIWKKDANGKPWISVACQGLGASVWYPCKDHQSDEPDNGMDIFIKNFEGLESISNGRGISFEGEKGTRAHWKVRNPINNYNIIPYIGDYVYWTEEYKGLKGDLFVSYYSLREDSTKARAQFTQVPKMLAAFEYWFGPYPFYEDGFKLIQSPHLGMEHQSAVAYGNKFMNGYLGRDLSGSGWGLKWDFIIVHESGHEWFANNITTNDIADMWVHEGFTNYSETLFTEYYYGKEAGNEYNFGSRKNIKNDRPIIAHYGVNEEGSGDMYPKASSMIHNIRQAIHNDSLFRSILIGLNKDFYHQTVTSKQIENYISVKTGINFSKVFDQYLRTIQIPSFAYSYDEKEKILTYQWKNCVAGFNMPIYLDFQGKSYEFLPADYQPQKRLIKEANFDVKAFTDRIQKLYLVKIEQTAL